MTRSSVLFKRVSGNLEHASICAEFSIRGEFRTPPIYILCRTTHPFERNYFELSFNYLSSLSSANVPMSLGPQSFCRRQNCAGKFFICLHVTTISYWFSSDTTMMRWHLFMMNSLSVLLSVLDVVYTAPKNHKCGPLLFQLDEIISFCWFL